MLINETKGGDHMSPWQQLLMNLANLIEIKTIITLVIVLSFAFKTMQGVELTSEYIMIATSIITYYFANYRINGNGKDR